MDQSGYSPESKAKANKLKKAKEPSTNGFKKMFGRKNRQSRVPEYPPQVTNGREAVQAASTSSTGGGLGRRLSALRRKTPTEQPTAVAQSPAPTSSAPASRPISEVQSITPVASPQHHDYDRSYDPSVQDEQLSRVDTADAHEARQAFSSFDQGPLEDVPAFVPEGSPEQSEDEAAPPAIARTRSDDNNDSEVTKQTSPVVVGDRWAQIRKNAAERAAARQSEEQSRGGYSQKTDGDDAETSGEESELPLSN